MFEQTILYSYSRNHFVVLTELRCTFASVDYCFISDSQTWQICFRRGLPPGDGVLFYPGEVFSSSHEPVASTRLERILSGMQVIIFVGYFSHQIWHVYLNYSDWKYLLTCMSELYCILPRLL